MQQYTAYEPAPGDNRGSHFSLPPSHKKPSRDNKPAQTDILCFDSREREMNLYPDPENYTIRLPKTYKQVLSIELLDACIPVSQYLIDVHNNNLDISYSEYLSGAEQTITVPPGNYIKGSDTVDDSLAKKMKELLESVLGGTWTIHYNNVTSKMTISVDVGTFVLNFNSGTKGDSYGQNDRGGNIIKYGTNLRSILGFSLADVASSGSPSSVISSVPVDFEGNKYIIFHLNDYDRITSYDNGVMNGFAKIALNTKPIKFIEAPAMDKKIIKVFDTPIGKLSKLEIKFSTFGNKYYNFNKVDHSVTFRITYLD